MKYQENKQFKMKCAKDLNRHFTREGTRMANKHKNEYANIISHYRNAN
jgi:hypothetical protein